MTPLFPDDDDISLAVESVWGGVWRVVCVLAELVLLVAAIWISVTTSDVFSNVVNATAWDRGIVIVFELLFSLGDATLVDFYLILSLFQFNFCIAILFFYYYLLI